MLNRQVTKEVLDYNVQSRASNDTELTDIAYHDHILFYRELLTSSKVISEELRVIHLNKLLGDTYKIHVR